MKTVSARRANQEFSALLSRAKLGEDIYRQPAMTAERKKAVQHAVHLMKKGLRWGETLPRFTAMKCMIGD